MVLRRRRKKIQSLRKNKLNKYYRGENQQTMEFEALGAAIAIAVTALATAYAQAKIGTAGIGALAEDDSIFGKVLILTVIPETIIIFGLVISVLLIGDFI